MLISSQKTGEPVCILLDDGYLTQVRTAAAGAVAAAYFAPKQISRLGVFGAGVQGKIQVEYLSYVRRFSEVVVWCLNQEEADGYKEEMEVKGFKVKTTFDAEEVASTCNCIVTATPSRKPLLTAEQIRGGTHITAMGSDTADKQELESRILQKADRVIVDSLSQGRLRGEVFHAMEDGLIDPDTPVELGIAIHDSRYYRKSEDEITVVDLTGVAVQDIQIAKLVWDAILKSRSGI
jgi:ornithine cyclodeaminase